MYPDIFYSISLYFILLDSIFKVLGYDPLNWLHDSPFSLNLQFERKIKNSLN